MGEAAHTSMCSFSGATSIGQSIREALAAGFLSTSVETLLRVYGHHHHAYQHEAATNIGKRPRNVRVIG